MDMTYRFRYLLYLAGFMLVMSVCFVYAEPLPSQSHLLLQVAPRHSGFLASSADEPTFDAAALRTASAPMVSPRMLQQLEEATHSHRGFLHRSRHTAVRNLPLNTQSESSVLGLTFEPTVSAPSTR